MRKLYKNVPVLDTGARGSTTTFVQRGIGDVLLAWENEAFLSIKELGADKVEIVVPSLSILAEPPVAVVDKVVLRRGTRDVATEYLQHLYTPEAQEIIARNFYRPIDPQVAAKYAKQFPKMNLVTIADFGGWGKAQKQHFADGGVFDQIYAPNSLIRRASDLGCTRICDGRGAHVTHLVLRISWAHGCAGAAIPRDVSLQAEEKRSMTPLPRGRGAALRVSLLLVLFHRFLSFIHSSSFFRSAGCAPVSGGVGVILLPRACALS